MKKNVIVFGIVLLFLGLGFSSVTYASNLKINVNSNAIQNKTIYVDDDNVNGPWDGSIDHPFKNVQDGVGFANDNDTVFVFQGIYYENVIIEKSLNLIGENKNKTIIDGQNSQIVVTIKNSNYILINSFTIQNGNPYGLFVSESEIISIKNNILRDNEECGIFIEYGGDSLINNNIIKNNDCGIASLLSGKNCFHKNHFENNNIGINLHCLFFNEITENNFIRNNIDATFLAIISELLLSIKAKWENNYWNDATRFGPKLIHGEMLISADPHANEYWIIPWLNIDHRPAKKPFEII